MKIKVAVAKSVKALVGHMAKAACEIGRAHV